MEVITMTKALMLRVLRESIVDTANYRYTIREAHDERGQWLEFIRLPIKALDTTAALDGWEVVKRAGWRPAR
jgi:2-iminoacetate synthase ThiH